MGVATYSGPDWESFSTWSPSPPVGTTTDGSGFVNRYITVAADPDLMGFGEAATVPPGGYCNIISEVLSEIFDAYALYDLLDWGAIFQIPEAEVLSMLPVGCTVTSCYMEVTIEWEYTLLTNCTQAGTCSAATGASGDSIDFSTQSASGTTVLTATSPSASVPRTSFYGNVRNRFGVRFIDFGADRVGTTPGVNYPKVVGEARITALTVELTYSGGVPPGPPELEVTGSGGLEIDSSLGAVIVLSVDGSGMYTLVPNQHFDRVYTRISDPAETEDVAIPTPFAKTGYFGA